MAKMGAVTKAVTELMGLDYKQFTQVAMIAPGGFPETSDRRDCGTRRNLPSDLSHGDLSGDPVASAGRGKARRKDYDDLRRSITQYLEDACFEEDPAADRNLFLKKGTL